MLKLIKFFGFLFVSIFIYDVFKIVFSRKTFKTAIDLRRKLNPVIHIRMPPPCELEMGIFSILSTLTLLTVSSLLSFKFFEIFRVQEKLSEFFTLSYPQSNSDNQEKQEKTDFVALHHDLDQVPQKEDLNDALFVSEQNFNNVQKYENNFYEPIINEIKEIEYSRQCDIDRFEERLEAVENTLKSTENVTKQWGERIDQAENELISLHSQMYTIIFQKQLNSENLDKNDESFFKNFVEVPDVIPDIKQTFEDVLKSTWNGSGDNKGNVGLLEKSFAEIDWKDDLKKDVKKQIEEVQNKCSLLRNLAFSETEKFQTECKHDFLKLEPCISS